MPENYVSPDWSQPLDMQERISALAPGSKVKGLFFASAIRAINKAGGQSPGRDKYAVLSSYPLSELIEFLVAASAIVYPDKAPREALMLLGREIFPALKALSAGTFLFSVAGNDVVKAVKLISRAYNLLSNASSKVSEITDSRAVVQIRNGWTFPDCYHLGILEGGIASFGAKPSSKVIVHSLCDVDIELRWTWT